MAVVYYITQDHANRLMERLGCLSYYSKTLGKDVFLEEFLSRK